MFHETPIEYKRDHDVGSTFEELSLLTFGTQFDLFAPVFTLNQTCNIKRQKVSRGHTQYVLLTSWLDLSRYTFVESLYP